MENKPRKQEGARIYRCKVGTEQRKWKELKNGIQGLILKFYSCT